MNIKFAMLTSACAVLALASVHAAETANTPLRGDDASTGQTATSPVIGFGSGTGMGPGGGAGSASSLAGGFGSLIGISGGGSQTFGGGFSGTGPLSTPVISPASGAGGPLRR